MSKDRFRSNEELVAIRKKHFLPNTGLYHANAPIQLVKAQGEHVWDSAGKRYLDAIGGIVCMSAGHHHPKIKKALLEMFERDMPQHTSTFYLTEQAAEATEALIAEAPQGLDRVAFVNSGSEANELAFMAARHATGETIIVNLRHSYHGGTAATLAQCGHSTWRFRAQPVTSATSALEPYCYRCPFGKEPTSCSLECAKNVETTIQTSTNGKIAALVAEPVMGVGGFITPPAEYFKVVADVVHNYGGKYISDEVQTGAGRCGGEFLITKELGIKADIVTMAKGLSNGAAVAATLMTSEIADKMAGKLYFNTFGADPYQMKQTALTIQIIKEEGMIENARRMGKLLVDGMNELKKKHTLIGDVRGRGLLLGMELVKDRKTKEYATDECVRVMDGCKERGLLLGKGGFKGNVLRITPPLSINKEHVSFILETLDQSLHEVEKAR